MLSEMVYRCCSWAGFDYISPPTNDALEEGLELLYNLGALDTKMAITGLGRRTHLEPFNFTPMAANSISSGSPHVRPTGVHRTWGVRPPDEIKNKTHPKTITASFRNQASPSSP